MTPPYLSGRGLGMSAIVTEAPDRKCASNMAPTLTSVSVSPLTIRNVPGSGGRDPGSGVRDPRDEESVSNGSACRGPPADPSTGFSQEYRTRAPRSKPSPTEAVIDAGR